MMAFWGQLKPSERSLITIAGGIIGVLMLYLLLLEPFMAKSEELTIKVAKQEAQVEWLKKASLEVKQLQAANKGEIKNKTRQSLLVVVDRTAKQSKLTDALKRVEPDGTERVRVWLDDAVFDDVAKWLNLLHSRYQLVAESAVFDKAEVSGRVNVRLVFVEGDA